MGRKTAAPLAPKLRFPEFKNQRFREVRLRDVTSESRVRNGEKTPKLEVMGVSKIDGIVPMEERLVASDTSRYKIVRKDWFAYNPMRLNIGSIARWNGDRDVLVSPDYVVFNCNVEDKKDALSPDFFEQFRKSDSWEAFVNEAGDGGVRVRIYYDNIGEIKLGLPSMSEQQKIAECLGSLDDLIAAESRKLDALRQHKKGLMQQLFPRPGRIENGQKIPAETTPRLRFPEFQDAGEWEEKPLSKVAKYQNGKAHEKHIVDDGRYVVVNSRFISTDGAVRKFTEEEFCIAKTGDVLIVLSDLPTAKALARCFIVDRDHTYAVNQRVARIRPQTIDSLFLHYSLDRHPYLMAFSDGINQTHLSKGSVLDCPILVPEHKEEQEKIAETIAFVDSAIRLSIEWAKALNNHKRGLLQQLFPSLEGHAR